jgi:hypothetical protein
MIMGLDGQVKFKTGGARCIFFPDGSLTTGSNERLARVGPDGIKKWARPIDTHHVMSLSEDGKKLLVMTRSLRKVKGQRVRFDKLALYDLDGKELAAFDFYNHRGEIEKRLSKDKRGKLLVIPDDPTRHVPDDVKLEFSHANAFAEIPENAAAGKNPAFAKGNFIVNGLGQNVFILDKGLRKILWSMELGYSAHDVQVLPSGRLMLYRNSSPPELGENFSTIEELDPFTSESSVLYKADPPQSFSSRWNGGAQILENGHLFLSDITNGGRIFEVDKNGKTVWSKPYPLIDARTGKPEEFQQARRLDLSEFLKNHKGL